MLSLAAAVAPGALALPVRATVAAKANSSTAMEVLIDTYPKAWLITLETGEQRRVVFPHRAGGDFPYQVLRAGRFLVYPGDQGAYRIPTNLRGRARLLGRADYVVPSSRPGRVWLVDIPNRESTAWSVREVDVTSAHQRAAQRLPQGSVVITGIRGGLLVTTSDGGAASWNPDTRRFGARFPGPNRGNLVDVRGSLVAWGIDCDPNSFCRRIGVYDLDHHTRQEFSSPPGTGGWVTTGGQGSRDAFSPDRRYLAVRAIDPDAAHSRVFVVELATDAISEVPDSSSVSPYSRVAWAPATNWVVFEHDPDELRAYEPTTGAALAVRRSGTAVALVTVPRPENVTDLYNPTRRRLQLCPGTLRPNENTGADGLPAASSQTDNLDRVIEVLRVDAPRIRRDYDGISALTIGPGGGYVWDRTPDGQVVTRHVANYAIHVYLQHRNDCPTSGYLYASYEGIELRFLYPRRS
jgi:hypothetical protein